jgi:hypothetical protein
MGESNREGGRVVDTDGDEARGEARFRCPDAAGHRDQAGERTGSHVHDEKL